MQKAKLFIALAMSLFLFTYCTDQPPTPSAPEANV